jgi:hypothetical protein
MYKISLKVAFLLKLGFRNHINDGSCLSTAQIPIYLRQIRLGLTLIQPLKGTSCVYALPGGLFQNIREDMQTRERMYHMAQFLPINIWG